MCCHVTVITCVSLSAWHVRDDWKRVKGIHTKYDPYFTHLFLLVLLLLSTYTCR